MKNKSLIRPLLRFSLMNSYSIYSSSEKREYIKPNKRVFSSVIYIERSRDWYLDNCLALYLLNISVY